MVRAKHITTVAVGLITACLSGCGYATRDSDTTASLNASATSPIRRAAPSAGTDSPSTTSDKAIAAPINSTTESAKTSLGTPPSTVEKLNAAINEILKGRDVEASLSKLSATAKIGTPEDLKRFIASESKKWTEVAEAANIKAD